MTDREILFEVVDGVGRVVLNRPKAINALSADMIDQLSIVLSSWAIDDAITSVELSGAGERGLCAGADVRELRSAAMHDVAKAERFFEVEYRVNRLIAHYPKPFIAHMFGITMGGGLGLSQHASRRLAAMSLRWAMPETTIGFFPDVGVLWNLSRLPGYFGAHLALTGSSIDAASAYWVKLIDAIEDPPTTPSHCELSASQWWIEACYAQPTAARIVQALEHHWFEGAQQAGALMREKSPLSVCVTLEALRRARRMNSIDQVLEQDLVLARNFLVESDFIEGVRAQLVDKDRQPRWMYARIEDVPHHVVLSKFIPENAHGLGQLAAVADDADDGARRANLANHHYDARTHVHHRARIRHADNRTA